MRYLKRRRVPKEFLKPRPMSGGPRRRHPLLGYLAVEILALLLGASLCVWTPFGALDRRWFEYALERAARAAPPERVSVVEVSLELAKARGCGQTLGDALMRGGARAGLLLPPIDGLCEGALDSRDSEVAPPVAVLPPAIFRTGARGRIVGVTRESERVPLFSALGLEARDWVRARRPASVPVLDLGELGRGEIESSLLEGRVVLVALSSPAPLGGLEPRQAAAVIAGVLEEPPRAPFDGWRAALLGFAISAAALVIQRWWGARRQRARGAAAALALCAGLAAFDLAGLALLLPVPSLLVGFAASYLVLLLPRRAAVAKADKDAERVLEDAGRLLSLQAPGAQDEGEFWRRLARSAARAHPADDVLVAELPAFSWRLKVWPNGESDESLIKERRRDIRRTPYSNLQGVPVASVVHDYLVMKGAPAVLVPLIANNDVEGYLILIGKPAADEFLARPETATNLAADLAQLIRDARQAREREQAWRQPAGVRDVPLAGDLSVLERARAATAELRLLRALLQNAPVGLFYADSFGDVRIMSRGVSRWLPEFGMEVAVASDGSVDPGALPLKQLMDCLGRKAGVTPPALAEIDAEGYSLDVPVSAKALQRTKMLSLRLSALRRESSQDAGGFVGSLTESAVLTPSLAPRPSIMQQTAASLQVFSLSKFLSGLVEDIALRTQGRVQLESPRDAAHVVAHRSELERALEQFLLDASGHAGTKGGPVIAVKVRRQRVELQILDLRLNAPAAALERTLKAPGNPPAGLESLGELVRAVQNSHGDVTLSLEETWGTVLTASLVRARPRVEAVPEAALLRIREKPLRIG